MAAQGDDMCDILAVAASEDSFEGQAVCEVGQGRPACGSSCRRWSWRSGQTAAVTQTSKAVCGEEIEVEDVSCALVSHIDLDSRVVSINSRA